ncbi:hypothetical protein Dimus_002523 [Dionaea muscipula]
MSYSVLHDMLRTSGFGWDDVAKMMVFDSDEVWREYVKKTSEAASVKDKSFPYYEDWLVLFGNDRATGEEAIDPFQADETMNIDELESVDLGTDSFGSFTLPTYVDHRRWTTCPVRCAKSYHQRSGKKRGRVSDNVAKSISEIATTFGSFFQVTNDRLADIAKAVNYEQDGREARKNLNDELMRLPLDLDTRMRALLSISKSDTLVDIFFSLKLEEERMSFIERVLY